MKMIRPDFDSKLTDLIMELNFLRRKRLGGTTPPAIFFQLKGLFHAFESLGSAHIEGNNTTVSAYLEAKAKRSGRHDIKEILNLEDALKFIDDCVKGVPLNKMFIRELHKLAVRDLPPPSAGGEGSLTPGEFRRGNVRIASAEHMPPDAAQVELYLDELIAFMDAPMSEKYDLLKIALAHHRFVWIHPFDNGNGRTVRLLTYAMLVKAGFNVEIGGRILNPTAIFCNDRNAYYRMLAAADTGTDEGLSAWCEYVLGGLRDEIEKIDRLCDYDFLKERILKPALTKNVVADGLFPLADKMLAVAVEKGAFRAQDFSKIFEGKHPSGVSRNIRRLLELKLIRRERENSRSYTLCFENCILRSAVVNCLIDEGFLPEKLR